ncbi:MAG: tetratricopeptide repeat protein [Planctomycetes bacterium]|nr:tetratricopeptide repeat protein [Planctomycetota bacterium]
MMRRQIITASVWLLAAACCLEVWAAKKVNMPATLVMANGIKRQVVLIEEDAEKVTVRLSTGKVETYKRDQIHSIEWKLPASFEQAETLLRDGDFEKAAKQYDITIARESNAWCVEHARLRKMQCCLILGKYERAVQEYVRFLKADPNTDAYGRIPLPEGKSAENAAAAKYLKALADLAENDTVKGMTLGLAAAAMAADQDFKTAEEYVEAMLVISNPKAQGFAKVLYGEIAVEKKDFDGAIKILTQNLKDIPDGLLPAAYYWLGRAYLGKDQYERAAIAFLRAPTYMPAAQEIAADCLYFGAKTFEKADRMRDAAKLYADLVAKYPGARHIKEAREKLDKLRKIGRGG